MLKQTHTDSKKTDKKLRWNTGELRIGVTFLKIVRNIEFATEIEQNISKWKMSCNLTSSS